MASFDKAIGSAMPPENVATQQQQPKEESQKLL
jgi:hypothetical protein